MSKVIHCDDGAVIRGDTDEELLAAAHKHMQQAHPDLDLSDGDLLSMAHDEAATS